MYVFAQICRGEVNLVTISKMPVRRLWPNNGKAVWCQETDRTVLTDPRYKECEGAAIMRLWRLRLMSRWMQSTWENDKPNNAKPTSQLPNDPQQAPRFCSQERCIYTSPHTTSHIYYCTVAPQLWECISLKGRDRLWKPKLPCSLCSMRQTQSFLGIVVLGLEVRYEKQGWKERSLLSELLLSNVLRGRTQALFILIKYIYNNEKIRNDLFLPGDSYSLARLS